MLRMCNQLVMQRCIRSTGSTFICLQWPGLNPPAEPASWEQHSVARRCVLRYRRLAGEATHCGPWWYLCMVRAQHVALCPLATIRCWSEQGAARPHDRAWYCHAAQSQLRRSPSLALHTSSGVRYKLRIMVTRVCLCRTGASRFLQICRPQVADGRMVTGATGRAITP
jgi:hypothetical protein